MKNKKLIVGLSSLLKVDENVIISELEKEDGDSGLISKFLESNNVFTLDQVASLKKNSKAEGVSELEKATEFPAAIYNRVKGLALEKAEKDAAKKHGIEKWTSFDDLVSQISAGGKGTDGEKDAQIKLLKDSLMAKEEEIVTKIKETEGKYTTEFATRDFNEAVSRLILEGDEEAVKNQKKLFTDAFKNNFRLDYRDSKTVVLNTEGKLVVNNVGDPSPVFDVYKGFALTHGAKIKEIDLGGRGDGSSGGEAKKLLKGKTFSEALVAKGVKPNTDEADKLFSEWSAENQK